MMLIIKSIIPMIESSQRKTVKAKPGSGTLITIAININVNNKNNIPITIDQTDLTFVLCNFLLISFNFG